MAFDSHANFAYGLVLSAPSPALSGASLTLQAGQGALMPAAPFNGVVWPVGVQPTAANAEVVRVTGVAGDVLTLVRGPQAGDPGGVNRAIAVGDQFAAAVTRKTLTDIEAVASGALQSANNLSDASDADASRANLKVPVLRECKAASATNIASLSGAQTVDTVALAAGDRVLLTAQTTGSQNGPWVVQTGAWTRPTDYATGLQFLSRLCPVSGGSANAGVWQIRGTAQVTVDTTVTAWTNGVSITSPNGTLTVGGTASAPTLDTSSKVAKNSSADQGTYYVTASGSDANTGLSWGDAFATIQAAITALGTNFPNGGIIEVGYGTFAGFTLDTSAGLHEGVHIRGRGTGKERSYTDTSVTGDFHPTLIKNTAGAGTDAITVTGDPTNPGLHEDRWAKGIVLEGFGVTDNGSCRYGINLHNSPQVTIRDVVVQATTSYGVVADNCWIISGDRLRVVKCGTAAATSSGGIWIGPNNPVNGFHLLNSMVSGNYGYAIFAQTCTALSLIGTYVERNQANASVPGSGIITQSNCAVTLISSWFEVSTNVGYQLNLGYGPAVVILGCNFSGNGAAWGGVGGSPTSLDIRGCRFVGHTIRSIDFQSGTITAENNICQDPQFIADDSGTRAIAAGMAGQSFRFNTTLNLVPKPTTNNGAVTLDCSQGNTQVLTMNGNVTSLALTNLAPGAELCLQFVQDATGGRTYTFTGLTVNGSAVTPKWAGGSAPAAGASTAGYRDVYRFLWDGTNLIQSVPALAAVR